MSYRIRVRTALTGGVVVGQIDFRGMPPRYRGQAVTAAMDAIGDAKKPRLGEFDLEVGKDVEDWAETCAQC